MRSLAFHGPDAVELIDVPVPKPGDGEALVRIEASALCGSELHSEGGNPGHEAAGVIEAAPSGSGFATGDRVGLSAVTGCGQCEPCQEGLQLFCANGWAIHTGMHADYVAVPISALRQVPVGTSARDAVLISGDTLGVPVRGHRKVPSQPGARVLVIGLGPVGLGHTLLRAHLGANVVAVEPSEFRRQLGQTLGAKEVVEPGSDLGESPVVVIECTGIPECIHLALDVVASGGTVLQSGECSTPIEVSPSDVFIRREVTYTGAWYYADDDYAEMVRLYQAGLPVGTIVTDELPAAEIAEAYRRFVSRNSGKVVVDWT